jgi:hypothetical protein
MKSKKSDNSIRLLCTILAAIMVMSVCAVIPAMAVEEKPDLNVTAITVNPVCSAGNAFANECNNITAGIEEGNGTTVTDMFYVRFNVTDPNGVETTVCEEQVNGITGGTTKDVWCNCSWVPMINDVHDISVTADSRDDITEIDEGNNSLSASQMVYYNGYKGKRYTGGDDIITWNTIECKGNMAFSFGDSYYLSASDYPNWTTYNASWTASDLPVPETTTTIVGARLHVPYTWDKAGVMPDNVNLTFNGIAQTPDAHYSDSKGYGSYDYPYGMLAYNVTDDFNTSGNIANLTNSYPGGGNVAIRGMSLAIVYADDSEPRRKIIVNEGFDILYGGASQCTTPEEATAYAPFGTIDTSKGNLASATLITFAPGAGPNEGDLIFNGQTIGTDVWNFVGTGSPTPQIGVDIRDVTEYLNSTDNEAGFQSRGDYMEASGAVLMVEYVDEMPPVVTSPNAYPQVIPEDTDNDPLLDELSKLSVVVTDDSEIASVTINLSSIGGSAVQKMALCGNVWYYKTNASIDSAIFVSADGGYMPHLLQVNATDVHGYSNTSVFIELMVMKNGDVNEDGFVNFGDVTYLANHVVGTGGYESMEDNVADVNGDSSVNFGDVTYLANHVVGTNGYGKLK